MTAETCRDCGAVWTPVQLGECRSCGSDAGPMTDHEHHYEPFHDAPATEVCSCGDERPAFGADR